MFVHTETSGPGGATGHNGGCDLLSSTLGVQAVRLYTQGAVVQEVLQGTVVGAIC